jgi:hypothetical protein
MSFSGLCPWNLRGQWRRVRGNAGECGAAHPPAARLSLSSNERSGRRSDVRHRRVYVVAPEAKPQMGRKDVVAAISEDMLSNGQTKKLVQANLHGQPLATPPRMASKILA